MLSKDAKNKVLLMIVFVLNATTGLKRKGG